MVSFDAIRNLLHGLQWCTQMMEKLEDALSAIEGNVALRLDRIEHRLDSMEQLVGLEFLFCLHGARRAKKSHIAKG